MKTNGSDIDASTYETDTTTSFSDGESGDDTNDDNAMSVDEGPSEKKTAKSNHNTTNTTNDTANTTNDDASTTNTENDTANANNDANDANDDTNTTNNANNTANNTNNTANNTANANNVTTNVNDAANANNVTTNVNDAAKASNVTTNKNDTTNASNDTANTTNDINNTENDIANNDIASTTNANHDNDNDPANTNHDTTANIIGTTRYVGTPSTIGCTQTKAGATQTTSIGRVPINTTTSAISAVPINVGTPTITTSAISAAPINVGTPTITSLPIRAASAQDQLGGAPISAGQVLLSVRLEIINRFKSLDSRMDSPPPLSLGELEGASRTHGGVFRGRAPGNHPNLADLETIDNVVIPLLSKVHLYVTANTNPADWALSAMSRQVFNHRVTLSLREVLQSLAEKHSPVRSKF
jgi:hypothetical protein